MKSPHWTWKTKIAQNGDVSVTLKEKNSVQPTVTKYTFYFESEEIVDFMKKNCRPGDKYYQPLLEGKIAKNIDEGMHQVGDALEARSSGILINNGMSTRLNPRPTKNGESVRQIVYRTAFLKAVLAAFSGCYHYDSPYSGKKGCIFNILEHIGVGVPTKSARP